MPNETDKERLVVLETDVKHIRKDTSDIKESINVFLKQISDQKVDIENLRVRTRTVEDKVKDIEIGMHAQNGRLWKISIIICLIASGVGVSVEKIFGACGF